MDVFKQDNIEPEWAAVLRDFLESEKCAALNNFISQEYQTKTIYPKSEDLFKAFWLTPFSKIRVVIIGQDPYHNIGQANGLCFSVPENIAVPPSLKNIYQEIKSDLGINKDFKTGNLESWAKQGVFLLNTILTVAANQPASHRRKGWEEFTDLVIKTISDKQDNIVFILWGNYAQGKEALIDAKKHLILTAPHPSPLSAYLGFFGSKPFSRTNNYLKNHNKKEIKW